MWVVRGGEEMHPVHLYNFKWTRSGKNVLEYLKNFANSVFQLDEYSSYDSTVDFWNKNQPEHKITHSKCNIHLRRYFTDAVKATCSKTAKKVKNSTSLEQLNHHFLNARRVGRII